jgi:predicted TIM-barrel fold metal-dependent hydrolase
MTGSPIPFMKFSPKRACRYSSTPVIAGWERECRVAVDFPDMPIIMAHPSFPWQEEAISVCLHKPQVYIDLSGWSPKYFAPVLVQYANTLLKHKVLFGSDYPMIAPDRWLADFEKIDIRDEVRPLILKENAVRLLGLRKGHE